MAAQKPMLAGLAAPPQFGQLAGAQASGADAARAAEAEAPAHALPLAHYSQTFRQEQESRRNEHNVDDLVSSLSRKLTNVQLDGQGRIHAFDTDASNDALIVEFNDPWSRQSLRTALNHDNLDYVKTALVKFRKYLSIDLKFDAVWVNIDTVLQMDVLPRLQHLLRVEDDILQYEACWVVTNIAAGTTEHCHVIERAGFVPELVRLCSSANAAVRVQAAWALGNLAGDCAELRDAILAAGAVGPLTRLWQSAEDTFYFRQGMSIAIWVLSNVARWRHFDWAALQPAFPLLRDVLLTCQDIEVVTETTWAICRILHEHTNVDELVDEEICLKLMQLCAVGDDNVALLTPALRALTNITYGSDAATQCILDNGGLLLLQALLDSHHALVCNEAAMTISNFLAGTPAQLDAALDSNILPGLVQRLGSSSPVGRRGAADGDATLESDGETRPDAWRLRKELVYGLSNGFSTRSFRYAQVLVHAGAFRSLLAFLRTALVSFPSDVSIMAKAVDLVAGLLQAGEPPGGAQPHIFHHAFVDDAHGFHQLQTLAELAHQRSVEIGGDTTKKGADLGRLARRVEQLVASFGHLVGGQVSQGFVGQSAIEELAGRMGGSLSVAP